MSYPKVSVIVSTCNRRDFLAEALGSLVDQLPVTETEILVINAWRYPVDRSVIPEGLKQNCRVIETREHVGQSKTINIGLKEAAGDFVIIAEDDDTTLPGAHRALREALYQSPNSAVIYSLPVYTDENGKLLERSPKLREFLLKHPILTWEDVKRDGLYCHGTATCYRKEALTAIGGWDESLHTAEEWDVHMRLLHAGYIFTALDFESVTYRRHPGGKSQIPRRLRKQMRAGVMEKIYAKLGLRPPPPPAKEEGVSTKDTPSPTT